MEKDKIGDLAIIKGDEIDLMALVRTIWAGRRIVLYSVIGCLFIGLIIAFTSPKKYTASATLLPSVEKKGGNLGNLSALAGMAGINIGGMVGDASGIPAELYPQVVGSVPYLMELMHEKLQWKKFKEPLSVYEEIERDSVPTRFSIVKKYTIGLPGTIKNFIFSGKGDDGLISTQATESGDKGYYILDSKEGAAIGRLKAAIKVTHEPKSGLISLSVTMNEPLLTAQLADKAVKLLQRHVIEYKTKQSSENLKFIEERFVEAMVNYENAQRSFFGYKDAHRNIVAERMDVEYQRLSDAYDIASSIYKGLAQQKEQAKITVKEETPVFAVLEPVLMPKEKSSPKRGMIIAVSLLLGGMMGVMIVLGNNFYKLYKSEN